MKTIEVVNRERKKYKTKRSLDLAQILEVVDAEIAKNGGSLRYILASKFKIVEGTKAFRTLMDTPEMRSLKEKHNLTISLKCKLPRSFR